MLVLSGQEYSELALEYQQKVKSKNYFVQVSNLTTKFLSVYVLISNIDYYIGIEIKYKLLYTLQDSDLTFHSGSPIAFENL